MKKNECHEKNGFIPDECYGGKKSHRNSQKYLMALKVQMIKLEANLNIEKQ